MIALQYTHYVPAFLLWLWRPVFCRRGWHAWDEVWSSGDNGTKHYLSCDACGLMLDLLVPSGDTDDE